MIVDLLRARLEGTRSEGARGAGAGGEEGWEPGKRGTRLRGGGRGRRPGKGRRDTDMEARGNPAVASGQAIHADAPAVYLPRYPQSVPATHTRPHAIPASSARFRQTIPSPDLHGVSGQLSVGGDLCADICRKAESVIAPYLTDLQARVKKEGIRIGSCESLL